VYVDCEERFVPFLVHPKDVLCAIAYSLLDSVPSTPPLSFNQYRTGKEWPLKHWLTPNLASKEYYCPLGWPSFPSLETSLPAATAPTSPNATPLIAATLPELCANDTATLTSNIRTASLLPETHTRFAFLPTYAQAAWHFGAEDFIASKFFTPPPPTVNQRRHQPQWPDMGLLGPRLQRIQARFPSACVSGIRGSLGGRKGTSARYRRGVACRAGRSSELGSERKWYFGIQALAHWLLVSS
jgi:hypothetical protein